MSQGQSDLEWAYNVLIGVIRYNRIESFLCKENSP